MAIAESLLHLLARARRSFPLAARLVPFSAQRAVWHALNARVVRHAPDRIYLEQSIIPALLTRGFHEVLSVGVEQYTAHHSGVFARAGVRLWTIDVDPYHARWGAAGRHVTGDVREVDQYFAGDAFDAVLMNGVIGNGVDDAPAVEAAIESIAVVVRPRGWLVVGWDTDRGVDVVELSSTKTLFERLALGPFAARITIKGTRHVYDHLVRNSQRRSARDRHLTASPA